MLKLARPLGLRQRMLLIGAAATLPILGVMGLQARAVLQESLERQQRETVQLLTLSVNEFDLRLSMEERLLQALARMPGLPARGEDCSRFAEAAGIAVAVDLLATDGAAICSVGGKREPAPVDAAFLADVLRLKRMVLGGQAGTRPGFSALSLLVPVLDGRGEPRALLSSTLDLDFLEDALVKLHPQAQTNIVLVNTAGTVLSPPRWAGQSVAEHAVMRRIAGTAQEIQFTTVGIDGHERLFAAKPLRPLANDQLYLWVAASRSDVVAAAVRAFARDTLLLTAMMLALVGALWHYGNKLVLLPLGRLREVAARLGKGRLEARTELAHSEDEIGQLAASFDAMAGQLERHVQRIADDLVALREAGMATRKLSSVVEQSPAIVVITNTDGVIEYVNPRFTALTGYGANEAIGRTPSILKSGQTPATVYENMWQTLLAGRQWHGELLNRRKNGELFWESTHISPLMDEEGRITHFIAVKEDITERLAYQKELEHQATRDALTGLANRNLLADRLAQALAQAHRGAHAAAVLLVDLDNFKLINDSLGHAAGDLLVKSIAERLVTCVREGDTVARMGGDEFVLIMHRVRDEADVTVMMQRIVSTVAAPLRIGGHELHVTCSTGAALYPKDGVSGEDLLRNADTAMYRAKEQGRDSFRFYTADMNQRMMDRLMLESELRQALDAGDLVLYYQPQVSTVTGDIIGAEALIRWPHAEQGMIAPARFIPLAEETGLIVPLGEWILRAACRQSRLWQEQGLPPLRIAVNISARQFRQRDFVATLQEILMDTGLPAHLLELELTESMVMQNPDEVVRLLQELKRTGLYLALDDFGTGYSSLNHLKKFPIDVLKLDQSFVRGVLTDADDAAIARTVIGLAHSLNLTVVAEGVETEEQKLFLAEESCDAMQGYYFGRPMPADSFAALLQSAPVGKSRNAPVTAVSQ